MLIFFLKRISVNMSVSVPFMCCYTRTKKIKIKNQKTLFGNKKNMSKMIITKRKPLRCIIDLFIDLKGFTHDGKKNFLFDISKVSIIVTINPKFHLSYLMLKSNRIP